MREIHSRVLARAAAAAARLVIADCGVELERNEHAAQAALTNLRIRSRTDRPQGQLLFLPTGSGTSCLLTRRQGRELRDGWTRTVEGLDKDGLEDRLDRLMERDPGALDLRPGRVI